MTVIKPRTRGKHVVQQWTRLDQENRETLHAYAAFIGERTPCTSSTRSSRGRSAGTRTSARGGRSTRTRTSSTRSGRNGAGHVDMPTVVDR